MTGPTGADQQRPGDVDVDEALAGQRRLYAELAEDAATAELVERIERDRGGDT